MNLNYDSIPRNGLVGEWLLDGNANDTNDGTKNNGTATNVSFGNTPIGYQKQYGIFDGASSYVNASKTGYQTFSLSCWVKPGTGTAGIIARKDTAGTRHLWGMSRSSATNVQLEVYNGTLYKVDATIAAGNWYNLVMTVSGSSGVLKGYLNGVKIGSDVNLGAFTAPTTDLFLGREPTAAANYFTGFIQGVRLYDRVISELEIANLYAEGLRKLGGGSDDIISNGLIGYWDFNGDANDIVGGYNGTVSNATLTTDNYGIARGYNFDGNNDYITTSYTTALGLSDFTFECLVNFTALGTDDAFIYKLGSANDYLVISTEGSDSTKIDFITAAGGLSSRVTTATGYVATGQWYHLVFTRGSSGTVLTTYKNGANKVTATVTARNMTNTANLLFGRDNATACLNGKMAYARFYNRQFTDAEVTTLYQIATNKYLYPINKTLPINLYNGLQLWIPGDNNGTTWYDASGNANNITATGSPTYSRIIQHKQTVLNGSSQYLSVPHTLLNKSAYSVSVWCKRGSTSTEDTIFGLNEGPTAGLIYINFLNTTTTMQSYVQISGGANTGSTVTHGVDTTKYNLYTQVFDGSTLKLYINGKLIQNIAAVGSANTPSSSNIGYGCNIDTTPTVANYFIGNTNNLMIFNRALSQTEIQQIFHSQFIF